VFCLVRVEGVLLSCEYGRSEKKLLLSSRSVSNGIFGIKSGVSRTY
jgi:hypothetical protein